MLRIKKGSVINHYGAGAEAFDHTTPLSQGVLAHLQTIYPDDIEKGNPTGQVEPEAEPEPVKVSDDTVVQIATVTPKPEAEPPIIDPNMSEGTPPDATAGQVVNPKAQKMIDKAEKEHKK